MELYYDFHIHSALSPCAENDMTPNNIVNMAMLKGLNAICVSDHNCADNVMVIDKLAKEAGILFMPGIEITTAEEVHVLVYFNCAKTARDFGEEIYSSLPDVLNNEDFFGNQYVLDNEDNIVGKKDKLLISATPFSIDEVFSMGRQAGGVVVPAHVNKDANSIFANLGFFPPQIEFDTIEVTKGLHIPDECEKYRQLHSSDAHNLWQIAEKEEYLKLETATLENLFKKLVN